MSLMKREGGSIPDGMDHLRQSISDILSTPRASRVMLLEYGSDLFEMVDQPMNRTFSIRMVSSVARALYRWEPRFRLTRVTGNFSDASSGRVLLDLVGVYLPTGEQVNLDGLDVQIGTTA